MNEKLITHIRERIKRSTLASPTINISREGWELIIELLQQELEVGQSIRDYTMSQK